MKHTLETYLDCGVLGEVTVRVDFLRFRADRETNSPEVIELLNVLSCYGDLLNDLSETTLDDLTNQCLEFTE